ncbi:hypothetical protein EBR57_01115, partial [bacterium]|nr:hypothetical protein [bacterium]
CEPKSGTVKILKSQIQAPPGGKLPDHTNVDLNKYLERRELGEQIKQKTGRSGDIDSGHIQLAQNIQIHQSELKELAQPLPPTAFATTSDTKVDAAIAQKLEFLAKGNDGSKEGLTPVIVKVVDGKVGIYELERGPQGETKGTTTLIGHLTQEQTQEYTAALKTADKSKSGTTDVLLSRYKDFDFTKPEIHAYLGQTQLKGMTDALSKISEALDDKRAKFDEVANKPVLHSLTKSINDHLIAQISSGVTKADALKDGAAIESAALAAIQASPPRDTRIPPEADLKAMIRYVVQDYQARGNEALAGVSARVELTAAAHTQVLEKSASESLAGKEATALEQISRLDSQLESISSGSKKSVSINLSAVVAGVDVAVGATVSKSMEVEVHRDAEITTESPKGKLVVDLKAGFGAGVSAGTGFLSTLSATLGVSVDGSKVVRCTFESDQKAAAFMAALESGRPELAICHVESVGIGSAKSVSIDAQLSGEFRVAKSITPSFEKNFKGTVERSNVPIETETGRRVDISKSASVHYDATGSLNIGGIEAGSSKFSFDTTHSTKERVNPTNGKIDSYSQQEVMSLFVNGETFTGSKTGKNIGEVRLAQTVDLDRLQQQFPAQRGELQQLLTGFDPNNQKLSVVETLKPDQVLAYNQTLDPAARERILLNPANYTMTISIVDTTESTSEKTGSIGVTSASLETHSAQSTFKSVTVDSSFSISRTMEFSRLDSDVITVKKSLSMPSIGTLPYAIEYQETRASKSQEAP